MFCLLLPKKIVEEFLSVRLNSGIENVINDRGWVEGERKCPIFTSKIFLSHSAEKKRRGTPSVSLVSGTKKYYGQDR